MTAETARIGPIGGASAGGDVVISIDAMGGDRGVADIISGMGTSLDVNPRLRYILHGDGEAARPARSARARRLAERTEIRHADGVIAMDEKPSRALRSAQGTSMWNALETVQSGESPVVISCGNTGALMALAMLALRKAPGVNRPAIAVLWPSLNPAGYNVLLDGGADIRADADDLLKFAVMGASYARNALGLKRPRVGLLNVGTEEHKGRSELHEAAERIAATGPASDFEYIGYVEGSDMPSSRVDVIVTDGFTGNVALKTGEGTASADPRPAEGGLRLQLAQPHRRALRRDLAQAAAEAHRPAPGQRRGVPRAERHGDQEPRLGRRDRRLGGDQARLHPRRARLHPEARRPRRRRRATTAAGRRPRRGCRHERRPRGRRGAAATTCRRGWCENAEFAATLDTSDEWIRTRTGIERRHFAAEGEATSDLAIAAARRGARRRRARRAPRSTRSSSPPRRPTRPSPRPRSRCRARSACAAASPSTSRRSAPASSSRWRRPTR